ncbi:Transposase [Klebsiella pneumoniae]|nr:Transposase [Klebsiella pneumoniae]
MQHRIILPGATTLTRLISDGNMMLREVTGAAWQMRSSAHANRQPA